MRNYKKHSECDSTKEYLSQALDIDRRINAKLAKITYYRSLAKRATNTYSAEKVSETPQRSRVEDCVCKIIELEKSANEDIDELVNLKAEIETVIRQVERSDYQQLLELRYICCKTWEQIAVDINYAIVHVWRLHGSALEKVKKIIECNGM